MRVASVCFSLLALASAAIAQLTPGTKVPLGEPFPIVADFNHDGLDDLIQERSVILNDGTSLSDVRDLALPSGEKVWAVLDVNGDHNLDLLTIAGGFPAPQQPIYRLYIGDGTGRFGKPTNVVTGPRPYVSDVDGDGKDDLVVLAPFFEGNRDTATDVTVMRSRGDGTFETLPSFRIARSPQVYPDYRIQTGDLDRDGMPDLVLRTPTDLIILHGRGGGHFDVEDQSMPQDVDEYGWWSMKLADIDGDTNLDIVLVARHKIRVLFGNGRGMFNDTTTASIPKFHDADPMPPGWNPLKLDGINQPRQLVIGHFVRGDRNEIAATTAEGDIVVYAYQSGVLLEVARAATEYLSPEVRPGKFRGPGGDDLYVMGTLIWGDPYPKPRVYVGSVPAAGVIAKPTRRRASHP